MSYNKNKKQLYFDTSNYHGQQITIEGDTGSYTLNDPLKLSYSDIYRRLRVDFIIGSRRIIKKLISNRTPFYNEHHKKQKKVTNFDAFNNHENCNDFSVLLRYIHKTCTDRFVFSNTDLTTFTDCKEQLISLRNKGIHGTVKKREILQFGKCCVNFWSLLINTISTNNSIYKICRRNVDSINRIINSLDELTCTNTSAIRIKKLDNNDNIHLAQQTLTYLQQQLNGNNQNQRKQTAEAINFILTPRILTEIPTKNGKQANNV